MSESSTVKIFQIDAFTDQPFAGNPAAVCILSGAVDAQWMQQVAAEMNLSETAFLHPEADGYRLRWFTPTVEVDLCGHATLASAHLLWQESHLAPSEKAQFYTRSGGLTATQSDGWITLDFPSQPVAATDAPPGLLKALRGLVPASVHFGSGPESNYLVELPSEDDVRSLQPDFVEIKQLAAAGLIATAPATEADVDFVSRYFAPALGINEDPVTGFAHCSLTPYWHQKLGKSDLMAKQVSARGGTLKLQQQGDRVLISGQAVTVLTATLYSAPTPAA